MAESNEKRVTIIPAKIGDELRQSTRQLKVAAYCRVSTDEEEQETSYNAQIEYYTDKILKNPEWTMAGIFADEGITGTQAKKRPEFLRMIRLCRKKKIDIVLTKSLSRFARNTVDSLKYIRELKEIGVAVVFEKENIDTLKIENEMLITLMSCFAQAESESISKNVSWGIHQSFKNGNVPMQYSHLLGYRKGLDGKPEIIPEEAETVKLIYKSYLKGMSLEQIKDMLVEQGIPNKKGEIKWQRSTLQSILKNEKYTGNALLQKTYTLDCISHKRCKNNGELPMYLVENHHEAIIPKEMFDRVQQETARRASKKKVAEKLARTEQGKYSAKFALTELLVCSECGTPYRRVTWTAKGYPEHKWRCINRLQYGKKYCHNSPTLDEEALKTAIVNAINDTLQVRGKVTRVLRKTLTAVLDSQMSSELQGARQRIIEIEEKLNDMIKAAATGDNRNEIMPKIAEYGNEMQSLRAFVESEAAKHTDSANSSEQLRNIIELLENEDFTLKTYDEKIVRQLLECVKAVDKHTVIIRFKGGIEVKAAL